MKFKRALAMLLAMSMTAGSAMMVSADDLQEDFVMEDVVDDDIADEVVEAEVMTADDEIVDMIDQDIMMDEPAVSEEPQVEEISAEEEELDVLGEDLFTDMIVEAEQVYMAGEYQYGDVSLVSEGDYVVNIGEESSVKLEVLVKDKNGADISIFKLTEMQAAGCYFKWSCYNASGSLRSVYTSNDPNYTVTLSSELLDSKWVVVMCDADGAEISNEAAIRLYDFHKCLNSDIEQEEVPVVAAGESVSFTMPLQYTNRGQLVTVPDSYASDFTYTWYRSSSKTGTTEEVGTGRTYTIASFDPTRDAAKLAGAAFVCMVSYEGTTVADSSFIAEDRDSALTVKERTYTAIVGTNLKLETPEVLDYEKKPVDISGYTIKWYRVVPNTEGEGTTEEYLGTGNTWTIKVVEGKNQIFKMNIMDGEKVVVSGAYTVNGNVQNNIAKAIIGDIADVTYTGSALKPALSIVMTDKVLQEGTDYTAVYSNNVNAGTATVVITGKGNYTGQTSTTFKILPKPITVKASLSKTTYVYDGNVKAPKVTVKDSAGNTMAVNKEYTVKYAYGRKKVGTYKVTIKGAGNYAFTKTLTFTIKPKATMVTGFFDSTTSAVTVCWKRISAQVGGFEIQYSTSSKFLSSKTKKVIVSKGSAVSKRVKNLKKKTKYYFRIRTYKTVNGKKYYAAWSDKKAVRTDA